MYMKLPTTGMKFNGQYTSGLSNDVIDNSDRGAEASAPSRDIGSAPADLLTGRCFSTSSAFPHATSVPSKVSVSESRRRNVRERKVTIVELSLRTSRAADIGARGPLVNASSATCGTYVKKNIVDVTAIPRVIVEPSLERKGALNGA